MFNSISWSAYFSFIGIATILYYGFVITRFYNRDIIRIVKQKYPGVNANEAMAQSFRDEVDAYLHSADKNISGNELLHALTFIAGKYPTLPESASLHSINQFIIRQTAIHCAMSISEEDVRGIWTGT